MRCGAEVYGVDMDPSQIDRVRALAAASAPDLAAANFVVGHLGELPFDDGFFDVVLCSAVLHFAETTTQFEDMMAEMWRVLTPGGLWFARLASSIGIEDEVIHLRDRWHRLPDGSDRFLVDEAYLMRVGDDLGGALIDPLKTTLVQGLRSMTTWVLRKEGAQP